MTSFDEHRRCGNLMSIAIESSDNHDIRRLMIIMKRVFASTIYLRAMSIFLITNHERRASFRQRILAGEM